MTAEAGLIESACRLNPTLGGVEVASLADVVASTVGADDPERPLYTLIREEGECAGFICEDSLKSLFGSP